MALTGLQHAPAHAQAASAQPVKFSLCYDLTKMLTFVTVPIAQAVRDYAQIINQRGGIEGHPIEISLQDHGGEIQRGIECYQKMKTDNPVTYDFFYTATSRAVLPRAMEDGNILLSPFIGRADAVDGDVFKWIFNIGPTYWGQTANILHYIKTRSGNNFKGVKVAYVYPDFPSGQEPIPVLKTLAAREGFDLQLFPYPLPGNDQSAAWTQIRRFNPAFVIDFGFAAMHTVAAREMKRNGIPMEKSISFNFLNEVDIANIGNEEAKGIKRSSNVVGGQDHPLMQQILKELYDKGKGSGDRKHLSNIYYNMGLAMYAPVFEGARLAIRQSGWPLTSDKMRRGLESITNYDANGLIAPVTVTAKDHGGGGKTRIDMWDGAKWVPQTDWISAYDDVVWELVKQGSAEFARTKK